MWHCTKNFIVICQKKTAKQGILQGSGCEETNMAYKCKIFEDVNLNISWALVFCMDTCVYKFNSHCNDKEKEINLLNKEYMDGHRWGRTNIAAKCTYAKCTYAYYFWTQSLLVSCFFIVFIYFFLFGILDSPNTNFDDVK